MNLMQYLSRHGGLLSTRGLIELAAACDVLPRRLYGICEERRPPSPVLAIKIERATNGAVSRHISCPAFPWPDTNLETLMPDRILRDGILNSDRISKLDFAEEVFFRRLMSVVDDFGRYYAHPLSLKAACYPLQLDKVSEDDIQHWLHACVTASLIQVRVAPNNIQYLEILDFMQAIKEPSKFPEFPPINGAPPRETRCAGPSTELIKAVPGRKPRAQKTFLPKDFGVSAAVESWAKSKGHTRLPEHLESFKAKVLANGYSYVDWDSAFREAIRGDWARLADQRQSAHGEQSPAASRPL